MAQAPSGLAGTIRAMRPFVPAKDFELSKRFYADLGFQIRPLGNAMAEMHMGQYSLLLQNYYVAQWADNFVMHMLVDDVDRWWAYNNCSGKSQSIVFPAVLNVVDESWTDNFVLITFSWVARGACKPAGGRNIPTVLLGFLKSFNVVTY